MKLIAGIFTAFLLIVPAYGQTAPAFVQDFFTWCTSPLPNGDFYRMTGEPTDPNNYLFPSWVPQQFYIVYARAMHSANPATYPSLNGQFVVGVDRDKLSWTSSGACGHDGQCGDNSRWMPLANVFLNGSDPMERSHRIDPPVFFDQSKDSLWWEMGVSGLPSGQDIEQACFSIGILEPGPGGVPAAIP